MDDRTEQPTVLVAEEDDELRERLAACLTHDGYRVVEVSDGLELLDYLELTELFPGRLKEPAVIVSDAQLSGIGGIEVCRLVGYQRPSPRFILLAPKDDEGVCRDALNAGVCEVLDKPVAVDELRDAVAAFSNPCRPLGRPALQLVHPSA